MGYFLMGKLGRGWVGAWAMHSAWGVMFFYDVTHLLTTESPSHVIECQSIVVAYDLPVKMWNERKN